MEFSLSEEQEMLKTSARGFLEAECPESVVREVDRGYKGYLPALWDKIADLGWLGLIFPEEYDGTGGNFLDLAVLFEEMGRAMLPSLYLSTVVLCGLTILAVGSEEQKRELLPEIVNGDLILSLALTEPESSWDGKAYEPDGVTVSATADEDDFVIDGAKLFVQDAHVADYILCATRTRNGANPEDGITLFLVDARSPGISHTLLNTTANDNKQSEVVFDNVRVPMKNMVGKLHGGWEPLWKTIQVGAVMLCAEMTGAGQRALEATIDYAKTRIQFEMPIGINQFVQEHCVQLVLNVDASRRLTYWAAWRLSEGLPCDLDVAMAKAWTSDAHEQALWRAHQVHAGVGSTEALGVLPLYTKRGNAAQLYLGNSEFWLERVTEELEKLPSPEEGKAPPRGLWDATREQIPTWDIWRDYTETLKKKEEEE